MGTQRGGVPRYHLLLGAHMSLWGAWKTLSCPPMPRSSPKVASLEGVPPQLEYRQDSSQELAPLVMPLGQLCPAGRPGLPPQQRGAFPYGCFLPLQKIPPNFVSPEELEIPGRAFKDRYKTILPSTCHCVPLPPACLCLLVGEDDSEQPWHWGGHSWGLLLFCHACSDCPCCRSWVPCSRGRAPCGGVAHGELSLGQQEPGCAAHCCSEP